MRNQTEIQGTTTTLAGTRGRRNEPRHDGHTLALSLPYRPIELVAIGGMSCVYRARDPRTRRPIAIKILRPNLGDQARAVATFATEYAVARRISHEGIVSVHEYGRVQGLPYLVMDWIDGAPLTALVEAGAVPEAHAAAIGAQISRALAAAHARGVIHCDIKPDNIMVSYPGGDGPRAHLIDFGVAQVAGHPRATTGRVAGTPRYMAPEQWRGAPMTATDCYALGCVLYELVTGRCFDPRAQVPSADRAGVSPGFESLIATMVAKGADGRPACMVDVARALDDLARRGRVTAATRVEPWWARARRSAVSTA